MYQPVFTQKPGKISLKNQNIRKLYHIASICQEKIVQIRQVCHGMLNRCKVSFEQEAAVKQPPSSILSYNVEFLLIHHCMI
jgi:hypothetical protein